MLDRMGRDEMFYRIGHINIDSVEDKDSVLTAIKEITNPNFQDKEGISYLHMACQSHSIEAIKILLDLGADPNIADRNGLPPVFKAIGRYNEKNPQILQMMIDSGLDLSKIVKGKTIKEHIKRFGNDKLNAIING